MINWTNLVELESLVLYTEFQGPLFLGYREENFQRGFTIIGCGSHVGKGTKPLKQIFNPWTSGFSVLYMATICPRV